MLRLPPFLPLSSDLSCWKCWRRFFTFDGFMRHLHRAHGLSPEVKP